MTFALKASPASLLLRAQMLRDLRNFLQETQIIGVGAESSMANLGP